MLEQQEICFPLRWTCADEVEIGAWSPLFSYLELAAPMMTDHGLAAVAWCSNNEDVDDFQYFGNSI